MPSRKENPHPEHASNTPEAAAHLPVINAYGSSFAGLRQNRRSMPSAAPVPLAAVAGQQAANDDGRSPASLAAESESESAPAPAPDSLSILSRLVGTLRSLVVCPVSSLLGFVRGRLVSLLSGAAPSSPLLPVSTRPAPPSPSSPHPSPATLSSPRESVFSLPPSLGPTPSFSSAVAEPPSIEHSFAASSFLSEAESEPQSVDSLYKDPIPPRR
ncbi:hypothetical protein SLS59_000555 [Nothophoma quercina]|uniref:Uncharacterized protein n=1 Tax=Nothophoma quercina TaxID=749835 RepID=A0ABR3S386_9PLEO